MLLNQKTVINLKLLIKVTAQFFFNVQLWLSSTILRDFQITPVCMHACIYTLHLSI